MGLSQALNKLSLISKLKLLESLDKIMKSLKFILQSQLNKLSEIADCLTFLRRFLRRNSYMFSYSNVKITFCFAVINSVAAITVKTIKDARAELFRSTSLK